jgi:hypothetical protein
MGEQFSIFFFQHPLERTIVFWFYNLSFILNFFPLPTTFSYGTCDFVFVFFNLASTFERVKFYLHFQPSSPLEWVDDFSHHTFLGLFSPFKACPMTMPI